MTIVLRSRCWRTWQDFSRLRISIELGSVTMPFLLRVLGLLGATLAVLPCAIAKPKTEPYAYTGQISFDIAKVPFSRYGSNLAFSEITQSNLARFGGTGTVQGLYLRSVLGDQHLVFRLELLDGDSPVPFH